MCIPLPFQGWADLYGRSYNKDIAEIIFFIIYIDIGCESSHMQQYECIIFANFNEDTWLSLIVYFTLDFSKNSHPMVGWDFGALSEHSPYIFMWI